MKPASWDRRGRQNSSSPYSPNNSSSPYCPNSSSPFSPNSSSPYYPNSSSPFSPNSSSPYSRHSQFSKSPNRFDKNRKSDQNFHGSAGNGPMGVKRFESFDALADTVVQQNGGQNSTTTTMTTPPGVGGHKKPATSYEETWDYSLRPQKDSRDENGQLIKSGRRDGGTIWLEEDEFQKKLGLFDMFKTCEHEAIKIACPCENKISFSICYKCHRVFCCNKCLKLSRTEENHFQFNSKIEGESPSSSTSTLLAAGLPLSTSLMSSPKTPTSMSSQISTSNQAMATSNRKLDDALEAAFKQSKTSLKLVHITSPSNDDVYNTTRKLTPVTNKTSISQDLRTQDQNGLKDPILRDPYVFYGVPMQAVYSYGGSFFDFYVRSGFGCNANESIIQSLSEDSVSKLQTLPLESLVVGQYCVAKYSNLAAYIDGWFRARITDITPNLIHVYFIDYGNKEAVQRNLIRTLPDELRKMRPSAIRISLGNFQPNVQIEGLTSEFNKFLLEEKFRITIFENPVGISSISNNIEPEVFKAKLEIKNGNQWMGLADKLQIAGLGQKIEFGTRVFKKIEHNCDDYPRFSGVGREIPAKISHVNHPNDFYVVREDCLKNRETITKTLSDCCLEFKAFQIERWIDTNYLCIAKRQGREWARTKIIEITEECTARVRFIDFGDIIEISLEHLKCIPVELLSTPQLAYRCSLPIFPTLGKWDLTDPYVTVLEELQKVSNPIVIVVFAVELEVDAHIVEVFQGDKFGGLSKSLLKYKKEDCVQEYMVDLDIRKKIHKQNKKNQTDLVTDSVTRTISPKPSQSPTPTTCNVQPDIPLLTNCVEQQSSTLYVPEPQPEETKYSPLQELEQSKSLHTYNKSEFKIASLAGFNQLYIQPIEFIELEMRLQDEIINCVDSGIAFHEPPPLQSIVIAPYQDGNSHRGIITKISNRKAWIEFIDIGDVVLKVPLQELVPASKNLLKYPKLVYHVKWAEIEDDPKLLLYKDFMEVMEKMQKTTHVMEMCNGDQEPYTVSLRPTNAAKGDTIAKRILQKQVWEWETILNSGSMSDTALLSNSKYRDSTPPNFETITYTELPAGCKYNGEVSRFASDGDVCIVDIQEINIRRDHVVLENQIARFVEKVTSLPFFPILQEVLLLYLPDIPEIRALNLHGVGKWNRCLRETSNYFRNIDYDEVYPADADLSNHFEFRRLSPEFLHRVSAGFIQCTLKDYKPSASAYQQMKLEIQPRKPLRFIVDHYDAENLIHIITVNNLRK